MNNHKINLMEVCGTHTMAIARSGIKKLLPHSVKLISGPGCPVCVTSQQDIDQAVAIAGLPDVIMTTFGDMMRVPGTVTSLQDMKSKGADIRVVYSPLDALGIAQQNPDKKVVFMGVGFETTAPTIAATIAEAKKKKLKNYFVLSHFKLLFPALRAISSDKRINIDGFICPGHVSVITGTAPYAVFAKEYHKPCVITGFEDSDVLKGIKKLLKMIVHKKPAVEIAYTRAVSRQGNRKAQKTVDTVFNVRDSAWRGFGMLKKSGLRLRRAYRAFDAEKEFNIKVKKTPKPKGCICGDILKGRSSPADCRMFKKACTPQHPVGPCMVSSEGTCAAYYKYR